ncbi:hypothetical protein EHP00_1895 [Ecytonucleospora hepatopenaei]|uniref:Uncharacterized protein n=1 Tax=Ecytonucleospora hepatopenaei TaxID=646526 RepID=A0A1W0E341_9MICR|nr:hypothetical protein EHP00_1895 [Ecytonucleospora hepatopenaei]
MLLFLIPAILCLYFDIIINNDQWNLILKHSEYFTMLYPNNTSECSNNFILNLNSAKDELLQNKPAICYFNIYYIENSVKTSARYKLEFVLRPEYIFPQNVSYIDLSNITAVQQQLYNYGLGLIVTQEITDPKEEMNKLMSQMKIKESKEEEEKEREKEMSRMLEEMSFLPEEDKLNKKISKIKIEESKDD